MSEEINALCIVCEDAAEVLVGPKKEPLCQPCADRDAWRCAWCGEHEFIEDKVDRASVASTSDLFAGTQTFEYYHVRCFDAMNAQSQR